MHGKLFKSVMFLLLFTSVYLQAQNVNYQKYSVDGDVNTMVTSGDNLILGGNFTSVGVFTGNITKFPFTETPEPDLTYPKVIGNVVLSTSDNAGGVYIYGNYYREDENADEIHPRIEHILANGTWEQNFSWTVDTWRLSKIFYHNNKLYISGDQINTIAGLNTGNLCAINVETQQMETWLPFLTESTSIVTFAISDNKLFFSGNFTEINDQPREGNAAIELYTGILTPWVPAIHGGFNDAGFYQDKIVLGGGFHDGVFGEHAVALVDKITGQSVQYLQESGGLFGGDPNYLYWAAGVSRIVVDQNMLYSYSSGTYDTRVTAISLQTGGMVWTKYFEMTALAYDMVVHENKLYIAGQFDESYITNQNNAAENFERKITGIVTLDAATGNMSSWQADVMGYDNDAYCFTLLNDGLFAGGAFTHVTGFQRRNICIIDTETNTVLPFKIDFDWTEVRALKMHENKLFVAGNIGFVGGAEIYKPVLAFDMATADLLPWQPNLTGTAYSIEQSGTTIFIAGDVHNANNERHHLFALDAENGNIGDWNPNPNWTVNALHVKDNMLYAGGSFSEISGETRGRLCSYNIPDLSLSGWMPVVDGNINKIVSSGNEIWVGGNFSQINNTEASLFAGLDPSTASLTNIPVTTYSGDSFALIAEDDLVVAAGNQYLSGIENQCNNITVYNTQTNEIVPQDSFCINFDNVWNGGIFSMARVNDDLYFGGRFLKINGEMNTMDLANLNFQDLLSSQEIEYNDGVVVYPNPANDKINVVVDRGSMPTGIKLFDLNGRQLAINYTIEENNTIEILLNIVPSGLYILQIETADKIYSRKVIIR
jgi:Secretion system C-terminal sorting domain